MNRCSGLLLAVIFILTLFHSALAERQEEEIKIGLEPEMNIFTQEKRFDPLARYLSEKLKVKVDLTIFSNYGDIIEQFKDGNIDGAFLGSLVGALAIQKVGVEPLVRPVNPDGSSQYWGYLFVRKDSRITNVEGMRGKRMAFVDKATTAGYIFPVAYLRQNGIKDIGEFFGSYYFTGSHDAAIYAVLNKEVDVGAAKNSIYERVRGDEPRVDRELRILATSGKVPENGLCVRKGLDKNIKNKLKEVLIDIDKDPEGRAVLEKIGAIKFVETSVADYKPVFAMARKAGIDLKNYDYHNK